MLAAGIDVFSTVNVQHLESLNDQVAELTGVRVRETFPDSVLADADEVVLVDVTPPALIERLSEGKVYKPERVPAALNGFFRVENLEALREVALRQVAEGVEAKRLDPRAAAGARRATGDRAGGAAGGRRAAAGHRHAGGRRPSGSCAGPGAPRSGSVRSSTSSPCCRPGASAGAGERRAARRAAPARLAARRDRPRRGGRRRRGGGRAGRARARHDLRADGRARAARAGSAASASRSPSGCCARLPGVDIRLVADRSQRRWRVPMSAWDVIVPLVALARRRAGHRRRAAAAAAPRTSEPAERPGSCSRSSAPSCPSARCRPRCGSPEPSTPSSFPPTWRTVPLPARTRRAGRPRLRRGVLPSSRRSSSGRRRIGVPVDAASCAAATCATRCASSSPRSQPPRGSSSPPRRTAATTASASTTSPGCCATRPARCSSSGRIRASCARARRVRRTTRCSAAVA